MKLHGRLPLTIALVLLATPQLACDQNAGASERSVAAPAPVAPTPVAPAAPTPALPAAAAPAAVDDIPGVDRDPMEAGLDHAWREEEGCKPTRDDADRRFATAFHELCVRALTNVAACVDAPAVVARVKATEVAPRSLRALGSQTGSAKAIAETCESLGNDYFCDYQGRLWSNPYTPGELRAMATPPPGDCAAVAAALPGALYPTSE